MREGGTQESQTMMEQMQRAAPAFFRMRWSFVLLPLAVLPGCRSPDLVQPFRGQFEFAVTGTAPEPAGFQATASASGGAGLITAAGAVATDCGADLTGAAGVHPRTGGLALELAARPGPQACSGRAVQSYRAEWGVAPGTYQVAVRYGVTIIGPMSVTVN